MSQPKSPASKSVAVVVSLSGAAIILCIGGAIAIAAPKFMKFQPRAAQSECKLNLKQLAAAQRALFADSQHYTEKLSELDVTLEQHNRYLYALGPRDFVTAKDGAEPAEVLMKALPAGVVPGVSGVCPQCTVTLVCVGAREPVLHDVWAVTVRPTGDSLELQNVRKEASDF
jgi:type II secretory pathway pseudopilin PulG